MAGDKSGFADLSSFVDRLRVDRDLVVVETLVDPRLEIAEIHRRVIAAGGPALLFSNVKGSAFPVACNLFGSERRALRAFSSRPHRFVRRAVDLVHELMPPTMSGLWGTRDVIGAGLRIGTKRVSSGPVTEVVNRTPRLDDLPALTSWSEDGGPFLTLPLVYTEHPDGNGHNLGMYRMQIHDPQKAGMHWQIGKGGGFHHAVAETQQRALPVTVFLGGPPALVLSAIAPLPENLPELMLASLIAGHRIRQCSGPGDHALLADAEFALVGRVPPGIRRPEGPFGDHYGYYSLQHDYPVFEVQAISRRRNPIFPATVVGKPRQEDFFIGDILQDLLSPLFPLVMPTVRRVWSYGETGYHSLAAAVVRERYRREAMVSAFRILGEGQLSLTKFVLVTDRDVDLRDFQATLEHILQRTNVETDLYVISNLSMDTLDYTGPEVNLGSKGVWLGLGDPVRDLRRRFETTSLPLGVDEIHVFCGGCLVVGGPSFAAEPGAAARIAGHEAFRDWQLVVLCDEPARAVRSPMNFLWTTFTRFEPAADVHAAATRVERHHLVYAAPVVIDARMKPSYPDELFCDDDTAALVDRRWKEYFPDLGVAMGDSERGHLD